MSRPGGDASARGADARSLLRTGSQQSLRLFLQRGDLYAAASEFEWARKLMPGHPDPHVNLGITLEHAGRIRDAVASYSAALESYPDSLPAMQGLAKVALLERREEPRLARWLDQIALSGTNESWRSWAAQRATLGR